MDVAPGQVLAVAALVVAGAALVIWQDVRESRHRRRMNERCQQREARMVANVAHTARVTTEKVAALIEADKVVNAVPDATDATPVLAVAPDAAPSAVEPWAETFCPGCLQEAQRRFPTIEPAPGTAPLPCERHQPVLVARQIVRVRLPCGQVIERRGIWVGGYALMRAATDEEVASSGWARCLWN